jgi:hypothetical protein
MLRSNSANAPGTAIISLPCGEVVSIMGSARERNPAPFSNTLAKTFRRLSEREAIQATIGQLLPSRAASTRHRPTNLLGKHPFCSSGFQGCLLSVKCLAIRAHTRISDDHSAPNICTTEAIDFSAFNFRAALLRFAPRMTGRP